MWEEELEVPGRVRVVIIGGEKAQVERLRQWEERAGEGVRLINCYGPTEATIGATMWEGAGRLEREGSREVPIGRGMANVRVYVADEREGLAPVGVYGEMWIGGEATARGYLGKAELTAEKFRPDPWSERIGGRVYCSGDEVRYTAGGELEYHGRRDEQVKISGYRIEPGEIEAALMEHPSVREAAVMVRGVEEGKKRLTAYVVYGEEGAKVGTLRGHLKQRVPGYMIPGSFVTMEEMPGLANGKIDRRRLEEMEMGTEERESGYVGPRTAMERTISEVWREVLGVEKVGVNDNFFDMGGASLSLIQVSSKLREALGVEVAVVELFEYPTIAELTEHLSGQGEGDVMSEVEERASKQRAAFRGRRLTVEIENQM
jgi:acyl-CoA synthetase (AMP-forming)/AMP-acid ligase II/acyl carrier protein